MPGIVHPTLGWLPSVTEILGAVGLGKDYSHVDDATLAAAAERGGGAHGLFEAHHYGYLDRGGIAADTKPYLAGYERFLGETGHTPIVSEFEVVSKRWRAVGHLDRIGWHATERWLIDWKCMDSVDARAARFQLAGYRCLWNDMRPHEPIHRTVVVQLKRDGTYRLHPVDAAAVESVFLAALVVVQAQGGR